MTKKDLRAIAIGSVLGLGGFATIWWLFKRIRTIPEISPAVVKWEGN
jgi:hypothetical protein